MSMVSDIGYVLLAACLNCLIYVVLFTSQSIAPQRILGRPRLVIVVSNLIELLEYLMIQLPVFTKQ